MNTNILTKILFAGAALSSSALFAVDITTPVEYTTLQQVSGTTVNVEEDGSISMNGANYELRNGSTLNLNGGSFNFIAGSNLYISKGSGSSTVNVNDGGHIQMQQTSGDAAIYIGDDPNVVANLNVYTGGLIDQAAGSKNLAIYVGRNGSGTMTIDGGEVRGVGNIYVIDRSNGNTGTLLLKSGYLSTSAGNLNVGDNDNTGGTMGTALFKATGGLAEVRNLAIAKKLGQIDAKVEISGTAVVKVSGADGQDLIVGGVSSTAATHKGQLLIATGGQLSYASTTKAVKINNTGELVFRMDSEVFSGTVSPLLKAKEIKFSDNDGKGTDTLVIDGSGLTSSVAGLDTIDITLIDLSMAGAAMYFYGTDETTASASFTAATGTTELLQAFLANFISFENFDGELWETVSIDDIYWDASTKSVMLTLTQVPEPATYAAIFGALALALAAYRRKR